MGDKVGEKVGEKLGEKTGEKVGKSLGEIDKLNLSPTLIDTKHLWLFQLLTRLLKQKVCALSSLSRCSGLAKVQTSWLWKNCVKSVIHKGYLRLFLFHEKSIEVK